MKLVLTGGAGFIGSCMLSRLNAAGIDDITIVDERGPSEKEKNLSGKKFKEFIEKDDFIKRVERGNLSEKPNVVIHFGACTSTTLTDKEYMMKNNYMYSEKLAKWALKNKTRFLYASSAATYGLGEEGYSDRDEITLKLKPLNIYGNSKHLFDLWVIKNKLQKELAGFKFFNVFGPNESHKGEMKSMVNKGYRQIKETGRIRLFKSHNPEYKDGEQKRDFIYVKDAIELVYFFLENPDKRGIFNIGTGKARTWNDLARALFAALDLTPNIEYFDMPKVLRGKYQYFTEADPRKLKKAVPGYKFFNLNDAVKDYVGYLEEDKHI